MNNYFVAERLGQEHVREALREADRARLARLAQADGERNSIWSTVREMVRGKVMPDAAGAREVPGL